MYIRAKRCICIMVISGSVDGVLDIVYTPVIYSLHIWVDSLSAWILVWAFDGEGYIKTRGCGQKDGMDWDNRSGRWRVIYKIWPWAMAMIMICSLWRALSGVTHQNFCHLVKPRFLAQTDDIPIVIYMRRKVSVRVFMSPQSRCICIAVFLIDPERSVLSPPPFLITVTSS